MSVFLDFQSKCVPILYPKKRGASCIPGIKATDLVLEQVDEGVDARVEEHHEDGEVVEAAAPVLDQDSQVERQVVKLIPTPTHGETENKKGKRDALSPFSSAFL